MKERKKFDAAELDQSLNRIAESLERRIDVFLIGGLAMMKHGLKASTKDIDIVFSSAEDIDTFLKSAKKEDFKPLGDLEEDYINLNARMVLEGPSGVRFDIFLQVVCSGLYFSPSMASRTREIEYGERMKIKITAIEDIFLFKAITTRPDDLEDMSILATGVEWDIIEKETRAQKDSWKWTARLYGRLIDLKEKYDVNSPLISSLAEEAEVDYAVGIIVDKLGDTNLSRNKIQLLIGEEDVGFVDKVIQRLLTLENVKFIDDVYMIN